MSLKINVCKFLLGTLGKWMPVRDRLGGGFANFLRCRFTKGIVKSMGKKCNVQKGAQIKEGCVIGDHVGFGVNSFVDAGTIFKGECMMGPEVHIYTTNHRYVEEKHYFEGITETRPVTIGKNVWLGYGVIILPGVTIGDNVIIGAGSVVTKDIPSGVMAAGNPCVVKKIIDKEIYEAGCNNLELKESGVKIKS